MEHNHQEAPTPWQEVEPEQIRHQHILFPHASSFFGADTLSVCQHYSLGLRRLLSPSDLGLPIPPACALRDIAKGFDLHVLVLLWENRAKCNPNKPLCLGGI